MKFISDEEIIKIPIKDNKEGLVNAGDYCKGISINLDPQSKKLQKLDNNICYIREGVAKKLFKAQSFLPKKYKLMIWDGYRSSEVQKKMFLELCNKIKKKNPEWTKEKIKKKASEFVADPEVFSPHLTGGAVDITIVDLQGKQLDMGTKIDSFSEKSHIDSKKISKKAKYNRNLLLSVMSKAGFVNYPLEWWHWSFGDGYWAAKLNKKYSIYKKL